MSGESGAQVAPECPDSFSETQRLGEKSAQAAGQAVLAPRQEEELHQPGAKGPALQPEKGQASTKQDGDGEGMSFHLCETPGASCSPSTQAATGHALQVPAAKGSCTQQERAVLRTSVLLSAAFIHLRIPTAQILHILM